MIIDTTTKRTLPSPTLAGCFVFALILVVGPMGLFRTSSSSSPPSSCIPTMSGVFASAWTVEWIPLSRNINKVTPPRSGHVSFSVDDKIYVFGGYVEETAQNRYPSNDLWVLQGSANEGDGTTGPGAGWMRVMEKSVSSLKIPRQRLAAAAVTVSSDPSPTTTKFNVGVLLGGWDSGEVGTGGDILNDIWTYGGSSGTSDTCDATRMWKESMVDLGPPTSRFCAVTLDDKTTVVIHNHRCIDDVMILDFSNKESVTLKKQPTTGRSPSARGLHAMTRLSGVNANKIILFGGAAQSGEMSNEVFVLDSQTWEWTPVEMIVDGTKADQHGPSPRASPCFVTLDDTTCLLFGGASVPEEGGLDGCNDTWLLELDFDTSEKGDKVTAKWTCVFEDDVNSDKSPPGRNAATMILVSPQTAFELLSKEDTDDNASSRYFLLHGGWFPFRKTYNEDFMLKVRKDT
mmetsp:Transcript_61399/g.150277  ORF Transcript_61399/g.150277 Transcript_61399/m.150277 type:complete len:458 (-) Transcript_61399:193-1566(-)